MAIWQKISHLALKSQNSMTVNPKLLGVANANAFLALTLYKQSQTLKLTNGPASHRITPWPLLSVTLSLGEQDISKLRYTIFGTRCLAYLVYVVLELLLALQKVLSIFSDINFFSWFTLYFLYFICFVFNLNSQKVSLKRKILAGEFFHHSVFQKSAACYKLLYEFSTFI